MSELLGPDGAPVGAPSIAVDASEAKPAPVDQVWSSDPPGSAGAGGIENTQTLHDVLQAQLEQAVGAFFRCLATRAGEEETTACLDRALQGLAQLHGRRLAGFAPRRDLDYRIVVAPARRPEAPPSIGVEDLTPTGAMLCQLWQDYTWEIEYAAVKTRVAQLTQTMEQFVGRFEALQKQIDNAMLDFNAIRRKIKA